MTFSSLMATVGRLPAAPLWGIARFHVDGEAVEFDISHDDFARDQAWATGRLQGWGVGRGAALLAIGGLFESPWIEPFTRGANALGATVAHADRWGWDARRPEMFVRRLPVRVVLGLTGEIAQSLSNSDQLGTLERVPHLLARPDALETLRAAGLTPGVFARIGPVAAVGLTAGEPLEYDAAEWSLDTGADDQLVVTTAGPRAAKLDKVPVGVRGRVVAPGRVELLD
ncbi:conserved hypothetical protein [Frankia canadensis]|uniref:Uncharacterized protein n=1 Tax=Frankia canadensis TaxID=1836972 RepID=A0A2I2KMV7_9ACTN|nr:hypothetical protein [Frankia canadensis]SNQ47001.1 conserved hypothetical protein [Frankia canadensis]SOU54291.1 conserved hypothetical protein [Frankia canadensis]